MELFNAQHVLHGEPVTGELPSTNSLFKTTINMAWPSMVESFLVALVGFIDTIMVSTLGSYAIAAVGLTQQPKFIGLALFMSMSTAISALVARRRGEQNRESAVRILKTCILVAVILTAIISVTFTAFADPIIRFAGSADDTHEAAVEYFQIIMGGIGFTTVMMIVNAAQRGAGNTMIALRTNLISNLVNICGNYLLINGHFGFPALGITGAAIATVFGTVVACVMSIVSICPKDGFISIPYMIEHHIRLRLEPLLEIIKVGYSVFIEQVLMRIGFMSTAMMAAKMGTEAMAAHQVGMNILGLTFSFGDGMQVAAVALIGRSLGERDPEKAKSYGAICRRIGMGISVALAVIYFFGGETIYRMFFREENIITYGVNIIHCICIIVLFQVSQVIYMGCLRGAGDTAYTAVASTISVTLIRTAASYIFGFTLGLGMTGIWMGILADQVSRFLFASIRFRQGKWVTIKI